MKKCSKCKIEKDLSAFSKQSRKKDGLRPSCKKCCSDADAIYRSENLERERSRHSAYYKENKEAYKDRSIVWRRENPEKYKECHDSWKARNQQYWKIHYSKNKRSYDARSKDWRLKNKSKTSVICKKWASLNPEKVLEKSRNRRSMEAGAEGKHTAADVRAIFNNQRGLCANCHAKLLKSGKQKFHVDHIMPLVLGGSNWPSNLQCLCPTCNLSKGAKHPDTWAQQHGRLL